LRESSQAPRISVANHGGFQRSDYADLESGAGDMDQSRSRRWHHARGEPDPELPTRERAPGHRGHLRFSAARPGQRTTEG
jgi:hypothetical protein